MVEVAEEGVENKSLEQNQLPHIVYDPRVSHDFFGHKMSIKQGYLISALFIVIIS